MEPTGDVDDPWPEEQDEGSTGRSTARSGHRAWEVVDLAKKRRLHGVDRWYDLYLRGATSKVGIIDWGFGDILSDPDLRRGITKTSNWNNLNARMFCQPLNTSTWPHGGAMQLGSLRTCEPRIGAGVLRHGGPFYEG